MYYTRLILRSFRNYESLDVEFHEKLNIITGPNAQGKTNLIEGIYLTSLGKSFRTSSDSELIGFGSNSASVKAFSHREDLDADTSVELTYFGGKSRSKKEIKINDVKKSKNIDLLENNYIVVFSPEDLRIVKDEPEKRRKFIDREICQLKPVYYKSLARYKKILLNRNTLLKEEHIDRDHLSVWDQELSSYGAAIMSYRRLFIKKLSDISMKIHSSITDGKEELQVTYMPDMIIEEENIREAFFKILEDNFRIDRMKRTTSKGPHRDDIKLKVNGNDIRVFGSQGQQRTAALSLKLAELQLIYEETGVRPVLLLDDVLSELDISRRKYLIRSFADNQIFLTTTEISDLLQSGISDCAVFAVENGKVKKLGDMTL